MKDKHELQTFVDAIISLAVSRSIPHGGQKLIYQAGQKFRTDKQAVPATIFRVGIIIVSPSIRFA